MSAKDTWTGMVSEGRNGKPLGQEFEDEHVHQVYEQIASHFSSTRYKPWPIIGRFLSNLPDGSIGLDVGCGNGKYLPVNRRIFIVASDRSESLVKVASQHFPHSSIVADILSLPHPHDFFDFAISIAVIHHLSTRERRVAAVKAVLGTLRPWRNTPPQLAIDAPPTTVQEGGSALFYVWALEQKTSRRGWDEHDEQDVMVPWITKDAQSSALGDSTEHEMKVFHRFYHLYRRGELEHDIVDAGGVILDSGYEKDNWWTIAARCTHSNERDGLVEL